jgi:hypothetical protein
MTRRSKMLLYWFPRVLCIGFALFLSVFALDVFDEHLTFWRLIVALAMHLVPSFVILAVLLVSWRWEWVGGILYIALGAFYVVRFGPHFPWTVSLVIGGPLCAIGLLFLANWVRHDELRTA